MTLVVAQQQGNGPKAAYVSRGVCQDWEEALSRAALACVRWPQCGPSVVLQPPPKADVSRWMVFAPLFVSANTAAIVQSAGD